MAAAAGRSTLLIHLYRRQVTAPFKPEVKDDMDVSNVANVFTREMPKVSSA